jgi:hypothetical protein
MCKGKQNPLVGPMGAASRIGFFLQKTTFSGWVSVIVPLAVNY